jgi:hypothetical protein
MPKRRAQPKPKKTGRKVSKPAKARRAPKRTKAAAKPKVAAKPPSALERLKTGVGNLFSRVTGRKPRPKKRKTVVPAQPTIEIMTRDIVMERDVGGDGTNQ